MVRMNLPGVTPILMELNHSGVILTNRLVKFKGMNKSMFKFTP